MIEVIVTDDEIRGLGFEDPLFAMSFAEWGARVKPLLLERGAPPAYAKIGRRAFFLGYIADERNADPETANGQNVFHFRDDGGLMNQDRYAVEIRNARLVASQSARMGKSMEPEHG